MPYNEDEKRSLEMLCRLIYNGKVIPIIGFDLHNQNPGDDILLEIATQCYPGKSKELMNALNLKNGYDVVNAIYHKLNALDKAQFHSEINFTIKDKYNYLGLRPDALRQLARIKGFNFYINATFFDSLEFAVSVYKVKPSEDSESKNYDVSSYHPRDPEDIKLNLLDPSVNKFEKPTIYNMLGTLGRSNAEYVLTDVDYMELLVKMISNENQKFTSLKTAIKDGTLLFIGCDFPDWILRMFLKFYLSGKQYNQDDLSRNFIIEQLTDDPGKSFFIGSYGIKKFKTPPGQFINDIYQELSKAKYTNSIEKRFFNKPVFISYNHDDHELVEQIQRQLEEHNILVWKDRNNTRSGQVLDDVIKKVLANASAIIPVLTNNVQSATLQKYYPKEWNYSCDHIDSENIKPIRTKNFTLNTIPDDVFHNSTRTKLLQNGDGVLIYESIDDSNGLLTDEYIQQVKELQYKATMTQIKSKV
jgi:hypothetical protein